MRLCNLSDVDTRLFDTACQTILSYVYMYFENTLGKTDENVEPSFHFQVLQFQTSLDFTTVINGMLCGMHDRIANCVLLEFLKTMFMGWYREDLESSEELAKYHLPWRPKSELEEEKREEETGVRQVTCCSIHTHFVVIIMTNFLRWVAVVL